MAGVFYAIAARTGRRANPMPKPNYKYDKRQRDLAKKKKQDEKRLRKLEKSRSADPAPATPSGDTAGDATEQPDR
jgi:hypothetical protein